MTDPDTRSDTSPTCIPSELTRAALAAGLRNLANGLSQRDIARATGVPEATISGTFRARTLPGPATVARLVTPFGGNAEHWVAYRNQVAHIEMLHLYGVASNYARASVGEISDPEWGDICSEVSRNDNQASGGSDFEGNEDVLTSATEASDETPSRYDLEKELSGSQSARRYRLSTLAIVSTACLLVGAGAGAGGARRLTSMFRYVGDHLLSTGDGVLEA